MARKARRIQERIEISADTRQATIAVQRLTRTVQTGFDRMERAVKNAIPGWMRIGQAIQTVDSVARLAAGAFRVVGQAVNTALRAMDEFAQQESGIRQMQRAFEGVGLAGEDAFAAVEALASERQAVTRFGDDVTRSIGRHLADALSGTTLSWDEMRRAILLTQDIIEATGRSAQEAGNIVARAMSGNAEAINEILPAQREYFRELSRTGDASEIAAEATRVLSEAYGGAATSISETELSASRLQNGLSELRVELGRGIAEALNQGETFQRLMDTLDDIVAQAPDIVNAFVSIAGAVAPLLSLMGRLANELARVSREFGEALGGAGQRAREDEAERLFDAIERRQDEIQRREEEIADITERFEQPGRPLRQGPMFRERERLRTEVEELSAELEQLRAEYRTLVGVSDVEAAAISAEYDRLVEEREREAERDAVATGEAFGEGMTFTVDAPVPPRDPRPVAADPFAAFGDAAAAVQAATQAADEAALAFTTEWKVKLSSYGEGVSEEFIAQFKERMLALTSGDFFGAVFQDAAAASRESILSEYQEFSAHIQNIAQGMAQIFTVAGGKAGDGFVRGVGTALQGLQAALSIGEAALTGNPLAIFGALVNGIAGILGALGIGSKGSSGGRRPVRTVDPFRGLGGGLEQAGQTQIVNHIHFENGLYASDDMPRLLVAELATAQARGMVIPAG